MVPFGAPGPTLGRIWAQEETEWIPENALGGFGRDFGTLLGSLGHTFGQQVAKKAVPGRVWEGSG